MTVFYEPSGAGPAPAPPPVTIITGPTGPAGPQGPAGANRSQKKKNGERREPTGAAGATGATGATGAAGATGATGAAGTGGTSAPQSITLFASVVSTTYSNQSLCTFAFDPSVYTGAPTFTLRAILEASSAGPTAQLQLFNLSTGSVVCTLSTSAVIQTLLTHVLTDPSDLPNSSQLYCLLLTRSGGASSNP